MMKNIRKNWVAGLIIGAAVTLFSGALYARDRGINQPGAVGGVAGVGAPGVGVVDPGINQPGALGNVGVVGAPGVGVTPGVGVGAPGVGVVDPGINQPGAIGNAGVARRSVRR